MKAGSIQVRAGLPARSRGSERLSEAGNFSLPLWVVLTGGLALSIAIGFGLRALGRQLLEVPPGLPSLAVPALLPATMFPVVGNCFGFYMSFRAKPSRHSMSLFIGIGALMTLAGVAISASKLPASPNAGSVVTTILISVASSVVILAALLLFVPRSSSARA